MANKFKSTADIFDSLSRQLVEQEAAPGSRPSQAHHGHRKMPEKCLLKGFFDPRQRAVPPLRPRVFSGGGTRHQEKQGELPENWNSVSSVDSLQLNSRGKPATVRCAASGQAQLPDTLSQAGEGSSNIMSRRGVSTSQNADTVLGLETEAARPGGSRNRYLEADPLDGILRNGRTKTTRPEVSELPNFASAEKDSPDEESRHSDGFANRSPSPTGRTKQDLQTLPSPATEAQPHRTMRVALGRKKQTRLTFGSGDGFEACDKKYYENQLECFLGALVQADHRWIGADAAAGHRIQIVDCSLGLEGELGVDGFMKEVYGRLDAVLSQRDGWETRFRELEAFVEKNGRLPRWSARSDLIRRRAEGWTTGDRDGGFQQNCRELKEYIELNGKIPTKAKPDSSGSRLAMWLHRVRSTAAHDAKPERRKMLEEVHPLVKELLQNWDDSPLKINRVKWEKHLEKVLHIVKKH
ncbi:Putative ATP-dependent helicase IRC3, partial [Durusdinium trenchii]